MEKLPPFQQAFFKILYPYFKKKKRKYKAVLEKKT
jgi:hypothetical protein